MPDERYGKCNVCRYCVHDEDDWACMLDNKLVKPAGSCQKYRPGCCDNCRYVSVSFGEYTCNLDKRSVESFEVCPKFDPSGRCALQ